VVAALPGAARLVYVTPSHQFPLGRAMSPGRRRELLGWAGRRPAAIVEDDYDSEFRFSARPLEPLVSLDTNGRVLYVGTFSKSMLPTIRTGFVLIPAEPGTGHGGAGLRDAIVAARQVSDGYGQMAMQAALARFIDEGRLARHVRKAGRVYASRHARIAAALSAIGGLDVLPSAAGLHMTALTGADSTAVVAEAARAGLAVDDLRDYSATAQAGFVFGFGAVDCSLIDEAMAIFAGILARHA